MYAVTIKAVLNGYKVKVGCQRLVFSSQEEMLKELKAYLDDPEGTENRYMAESVNAKQMHTNETMGEMILRNLTWAKEK